MILTKQLSLIELNQSDAAPGAGLLIQRRKHAARAAHGRQIRLSAITGTDKKNPTALNAVGFPVLLFHNRKLLMKAWSLLKQTGNRLPDPQ